MAETGTAYKINDRQIIIYPKPAKSSNTKEPPSEKIKIQGKVADSNNNVIPGVNIMIKGTNTGTITDFDGMYSIEVADENAILIFSFIGYKVQEIKVGTQITIDVILEEDVSNLEEVVVVGYGSKKKSDIIGSVSVINSEEISSLPVPTIAQALQGKATGVRVTQSSGAPGGGIEVRIRGIGTINDNTPLYIVDGIPTKDAFNSLSPSDVESISVLKDAAASIYGARAANGVVIITTKKGSQGDSKVNYSTYTGFQVASNLTEMCNKNQYIELYNEAATADERELIPLGMIDSLPNTNWWDEIFRPALITNHHLTVSGANENSNYIISGNYFKQDGIILNSGYNRYSLKTSVQTKISEKLKGGININISRAETDLVGSSGDGYGGNGGSVVRYALFRTPIYPVNDQNGNYIDYYPDNAHIFGDGYNPVGFAEKYDWTKVNNRVFGIGTLFN